MPEQRMDGNHGGRHEQSISMRKIKVEKEDNVQQQQQFKETPECIIKIEPADDADNIQSESCTSSSVSHSPFQDQTYMRATDVNRLFQVPSMAIKSYDRFPGASRNFEIVNNESTPKTPFERFKNKILSAIKLEFPRAGADEWHEIAASRWNLLSEEQRRGFCKDGVEENTENERAMENANAVRNYQPWSRKDPPQGASVQTSDSRSPQECGSAENKTGACTWCKSFASLSDYSSKFRGREIYCTGLCSQKCFEQAAEKIYNVECGYDLSRTVRPRNQQRPLIKTTLPALECQVPPNRQSTRQQEVLPVRIPNQTLHREDPENRKSPRVSRVNNSVNQDPVYNITENKFNWTEYLERTVSVAAPATCFKQTRTTPRNGFKEYMKVECLDPKQNSVLSLATVVTVLGPRIRLRFDGCGTTEDIWRLPDSDDIHPVGWCEGNRGLLQAPTGFLRPKENYLEFVRRAVQIAESAHPSLFKREPATPRENNFKAGMKLEAVVKNNPALIGVATVVEVDDNRIRVEFDGYPGAGYWTYYSDRDLFNAGWCYNNGYPLQPPGESSLQNQSKTFHSEMAMSISPGEKQRKPPTPTPCYGEVDVHINAQCDPGPYLDTTKFSSIASAYRGGVAVVLKSLLEELIPCAYDPKTVFGFLKPGRGNIEINVDGDGVACKCCLSDVDRVSSFWKVMEQFCDSLQCCSNFISGFELQTTCPQCLRGSGSRKGRSSGKKRNYSADDDMQSKQQCRSSTPDSTAVSASYGEHIVRHHEFPEKAHKKRRLEYVEAELSTSPRTWSVDDVAQFVESTDLKDFITILRKNDIDGKALMLLNQEIIINYMGLKIGPAVKLLLMIDELKDAASQWD